VLDIPLLLANEFSLRPQHVSNAITLFAEGATVPFIARYRKEMTGEMNEIVLRGLLERHTYLVELEDRKKTVLKSIEEQGKLTEELRARIEACLQKTELEDLYLPYKPKRRTRATVAREKGLEPLADFIRSVNTPEAAEVDLLAEAVKYVSETLGVSGPQEALAGASDILAEEVSEKAQLRAWAREFIFENGTFSSSILDGFPEGTTKYEMYRNFKAPVSSIAPHNMLAMRRGETENVLSIQLLFDVEAVLDHIRSSEVRASDQQVRALLDDMIKDAFERLMRTTLITEVRLDRKSYSDTESIKTFEDNLRNLLLASPAGMKPTLGVDPGIRTGCKIVAIDVTGKFLEYRLMHLFQSEAQKEQARSALADLVKKYGIELVAVGNGTAGRETEAFVKSALEHLSPRPLVIMVSESGASVYSASDAAIDEFPDLDLTIRGAISIARRLQDPLAELVKIDPKSIGVGQYQHDVDQKLLRRKLDETVESCVNHVGVDINLASKELLSRVSGLNPAVAKSIVEYRNEHGAFNDRQELMNVPRFGTKAFEQSAGFLRIRNGRNPLDNTAVHPESYPVVERIAGDLDISIEKIAGQTARLRSLDLARYVGGTIGLPTLRDILAELEKPGRDPRSEFVYARFKEGISEITDLQPGMVLEGIVTNVANFGAFVDIGVHQDGLVHVSQLANRFVKDPRSVVKVGQIVKVTVVEVNVQLKRIALSMKTAPMIQGTN
jgi:uncharacterized protein